jgi:tRNA A37 threonylcarbamoyladenosine dehydratase
MKNIEGFLDQRNPAKMWWLQDTQQRNLENLNNARREISRHIGNKKKEYLKAKIDEIEPDIKITISETCVGMSMILVGVTGLELT